MPNSTSTTLTHWALLIGIDFYVKSYTKSNVKDSNDPEKDPCLKGCVRDVEAIKEYLEEGSTPVNITMLTATTPLSRDAKVPVEEPNSWPTLENVTESLKGITEEANKGDFVYVHYSGHGSRLPVDERHPAGNLALVLFRKGPFGIKYLLGDTLAGYIGKMVEKGLLVTLLLDCCFSGSTLRTDEIQGTDTRALPWDPAVDEASFIEDPIDTGNMSRNTTISSDQWIIAPNGYAILAACGPHEIAQELTVGIERRGALSYFLLESLGILRKTGVDITLQSLYQRLRSQFHVSWPSQTPMRFGNKNFSFFGKLMNPSIIPFVPIYNSGDSLLLDAGLVHGVHQGDEYGAYPFDTPEDGASESTRPSVMVRVGTVRNLTSDLVVISEPPLVDGKIRTGWKARLVTSVSPHRTAVKLWGDAENRIQLSEADVEPSLRFFLHDGGTEPCMFHVTFDEQLGYEILDGLRKRIVGLRPIRADAGSSCVVNVLRHLAKFKYFEGLDNHMPNPTFENSFSFRGTEDSNTPRDGCSRKWHLEIENLGFKPLYIAIFNLTPSFQIVNLLSEHEDCLVIEPKVDDESEKGGRRKLPFEMTVPDFLRDQGEKECDDIIKVFITSKLVHFPSMILPDIWDTAKGGFRGGNSQRMSDFLHELTTVFRGGDNVAGEEWASRNFFIHTTEE